MMKLVATSVLVVAVVAASSASALVRTGDRIESRPCSQVTDPGSTISTSSTIYTPDNVDALVISDGETDKKMGWCEKVLSSVSNFPEGTKSRRFVYIGNAMCKSLRSYGDQVCRSGATHAWAPCGFCMPEVKFSHHYSSWLSLCDQDEQQVEYNCKRGDGDKCSNCLTTALKFKSGACHGFRPKTLTDTLDDVSFYTNGTKKECQIFEHRVYSGENCEVETLLRTVNVVGGHEICGNGLSNSTGSNSWINLEYFGDTTKTVGGATGVAFAAVLGAIASAVLAVVF